MLRRFSLLLSGAALALLLLLAFDNTVQAGRGGGGGGGGRGGGGGGRGGGGFGGGGRGGFGAGRGGFGGGRGGFGGGFGRGGFGRGGFGGGGFGGGWGYGGWGWGGWGYGGWGGWGLYWPYYGYYQPYYGDSVYGVYAAPGYDAAAYVDYATAAPANGSITLVAQKPPGGDRRPDDTAHLQLKLPENAELWINGTKYPQAGKLQEVVTPTLTPGKKYAYMIDVHVKDSTGKESVDRRKIRFRANDWVSIDLTRPAPTVIAGPAPLPVEEKAN